MTEIDLVQASASMISLAYTTSGWWITITTALVLSVYFAAKHIAPWFLALVVLLYVVGSISVIFEMSEYSALANSYGVQLTQMRIAHHEINANIEPNFALRVVNAYANYVIIAVGTVGATAFSFMHWRNVRGSA